MQIYGFIQFLFDFPWFRYPVGILSLRDQALILKFKSAHTGYRDQVFKIEDTPHKSSDLRIHTFKFVLQVGTKNVRARQYPWGVVQVCSFHWLIDWLVYFLIDWLIRWFLLIYDRYAEFRINVNAFKRVNWYNGLVTWQVIWFSSLLII